MADYSFLIGLWKTLKNGLIWWAPALITFLSNVPIEYAGVASVLIYILKNWYENRPTAVKL
jgi:hypothetical protein